jgi:cytochrome c biogenesis protein CcmG/thiol:disulfide interchange protein DsbE
MSKQLKYGIPLVAFVVLVVLLWRGLSLDPRKIPSPFIGKPAPAFSLPLLSDASATLAPEDLAGEVWLLNVWASWCVSCRAEHEVVKRLVREHGLKILGLNYKDETVDATAWLKRLGDPYFASVVDANGDVGIDWGVYGVPETFVIDKKGTIRYKHIGPVTDASAAETILPLVQELESES